MTLVVVVMEKLAVIFCEVVGLVMIVVEWW